jgi:hypothetical protein
MPAGPALTRGGTVSPGGHSRTPDGPDPPARASPGSPLTPPCPAPAPGWPSLIRSTGPPAPAPAPFGTASSLPRRAPGLSASSRHCTRRRAECTTYAACNVHASNRDTRHTSGGVRPSGSGVSPGSTVSPRAQHSGVTECDQTLACTTAGRQTPLTVRTCSDSVAGDPPVTRGPIRRFFSLGFPPQESMHMKFAVRTPRPYAQTLLLTSNILTGRVLLPWLVARQPHDTCKYVTREYGSPLRRTQVTIYGWTSQWRHSFTWLKQQRCPTAVGVATAVGHRCCSCGAGRSPGPVSSSVEPCE